MSDYAENQRGMSRRRFLAGVGAASTLGGVLNTHLLASDAKPFTLASLPYSYAALEPYINQATMQRHHDTICAAYVSNLNKLAADHAPYLTRKKVEDIVARGLYTVPEEIREGVRENAGGIMNHDLFFRGMTPNAGEAPVGKLAEAIQNTFASYDKWKEKFTAVALKRAGSGWAWLVRGDMGKLEITSTQNQDSPWANMQYPIVGLDVCEHAYQLQYQTRCADYIAAWYNVVNWTEAEKRFGSAPKG